jgi:hypothetical protein
VRVAVARVRCPLGRPRGGDASSVQCFTIKELSNALLT